jgi:3-oxoadipate enol-lactonase
MNELQSRFVAGPAGSIAIYTGGNAKGAPVLLSHSILASSAMWRVQAELLIERGYRVICMDTRGHGASDGPPPPYTMADLVADHLGVLDAMDIERAHFVGLSLGGMSGFGLGIAHGDRLLSLVLCDARADAPEAVAAPWNDRIVAALEHGCSALAVSTCERWFGKAFMSTQSAITHRFERTIAATSVDGFVGCARAIQGLDYLRDVRRITTPTTLVVGQNDGPLPAAMHDLQQLIPGSVLEVIPAAGHLPNIDQPAAFNAALLRHFERIAR